MASVGVSVAAWSALATQVGVGQPITQTDLGLAIYEFVIITLVALVIERIWTPRLNQVVTWIVAPILVLVGVRFLIMAAG